MTPATTPAKRINRAMRYLFRAAAQITPASPATARITGHGDAGVPRKIAGGFLTSFSAESTRRTPTPSCSARTTVLVNRRATTSATRLIESRSRNSPISSPAACMTPGATRLATATAVRAFSGCTGKGRPDQAPDTITRVPATSNTVPASSPFTRTSAASSGTKTPRSATDPDTSPIPIR